MLERMRKSSQSLLIYVLFGIVIAVFIINFGPQSRGGCDGPAAAGDHYAAKVAGDVISTSDFRYGFLFVGGAHYPANMAKQQHLKEMVMDKLIERELLAQEAERMGFVVTDDEVEDMVAEAKIVGLGYPRTVTAVQKDGKFNYDAFKNYVQFELSLNPKSFIQEQKRELLASRVRDLMRGSVKVSMDEVKTDFVRKGQQVNLEYMRFPSRKYEDRQEAASDAELAEYAKKNEAKLKELYEQRKFMYEKTPKELRIRQIVVKPVTSAGKPVTSAGKPATVGDAAAADKAAEKKASDLAARIAKGEPFAKVAKEASDDAATRGRGGELGWRHKGATAFESKVEEKLFAAKTGQVVGPVKVASGWALLVSEGSREGDLTFDAVKLELAAEKVRQEKALALAKADAEAALAQAKAAPGKTLKELFPAKSEGDAKSAKAKTGDEDESASDTARAEETGLFSRRAGRDGAVVEGIGTSNALSKAAFELKADAPLAGPFEITGSYVIVRLKERKEPDLAEFEKKKLELRRDAELTKWIEVLSDWSHQRCVDAKAAKRITINRDVLRYEDSAEPPPYEPCAPRRSLGG